MGSSRNQMVAQPFAPMMAAGELQSIRMAEARLYSKNDKYVG